MAKRGLLIDTSPRTSSGQRSATRIRPARLYTNFKDGRFSHLVQPELSPTWVVPTRHPEALGQALKAIPGHRGPVRPQ
jgi:hypothetical protein